MNQQKFARIDKGLKRADRKAARAVARREPRAATSYFHSPEVKQAAIQDALETLTTGASTDIIAKRHGVPGRTLRSWLLADETVSASATAARRTFLSAELTLRADDIDNADDPMSLARAREAFRAWSWMAERREPALFGAKHEVTHFTHADWGERLRRARERVIEAEPKLIESKSVTPSAEPIPSL